MSNTKDWEERSVVKAFLENRLIQLEKEKVQIYKLLHPDYKDKENKIVYSFSSIPMTEENLSKAPWWKKAAIILNHAKTPLDVYKILDKLEEYIYVGDRVLSRVRLRTAMFQKDHVFKLEIPPHSGDRKDYIYSLK